MNKMYYLEVVEYTGAIKTDTIKTGIYDTLEQAIYSGKSNLVLYIRGLTEIKKDIPIHIQIQDFIENASYHDTEYNIIIHVFSTDRKQFNEPRELMEYLDKNIVNVPDYKLYDFLLSLVEYDTRIYDYNGNYQSNIIIGRNMLNIRSYDLDFTEASCMCRKYRFNYL